ncbi:MAG: TlpA disulfide reductase family protein [Dehalococcoidia bacterium]
MESAPARQRGLVRRFLYPLAVIAVIAGVIWWLEYRGGGAFRDDEYGPRDLPSELASDSLSVKAEEGSLAPDFLLESVAGNETRLTDFRGHPVVLNFWASWCRPCRQEMPLLVDASRRYVDDGLVVIGLNLQEGKALIEAFADDYGIEFPLLMDRDGEVGDRYRLLGLPTTFFIDTDGVIQSVFTGPLEDKVDDQQVQGAIGATDLDERISQIIPKDISSGD